jgi:hypothetical protein
VYQLQKEQLMDIEPQDFALGVVAIVAIALMVFGVI